MIKRRSSKPSKPTSPGRFRYATICSGIEAPSVAWQSLGWDAAWFSEIEPFPCSVLAHHYPKVPNLGDITKITEEQIDRLGPIDLVCGGTPCQGFSVAGLRKGLDDPRSNLALRFLQLIGHIRPVWFLWENVPGVLSSWSAGKNSGIETNDFDQFLAAILELGYGFAYRVLDAQYFGVPQRRRRVFVVGYFGDWRPAAAVLFERESLRRNPPPGRTTGKNFAHATSPCIGASGRGFERTGESRGQDPVVVGTLKACSGKSGTPNGAEEASRLVVGKCLNGHGSIGRIDAESETFVCGTLPTYHSKLGHGMSGVNSQAVQAGHVVPVAYRTSGNCGVMEQGDRTAALNCNTDQTQQIIAFQTRIGRNGRVQPKEITDALTSADNGTHADSKPHVAGSFGVRRLTPRECERLQGFPDDYTLIDFNGKPSADSPRSKALGNSMAVPVVRWIGERIAKVNGILEARKQSHDSIDHR